LAARQDRLPFDRTGGGNQPLPLKEGEPGASQRQLPQPAAKSLMPKQCLQLSHHRSGGWLGQARHGQVGLGHEQEQVFFMLKLQLRHRCPSLMRPRQKASRVAAMLLPRRWACSQVST
jgi:hypothetical protein